jgi:hypothetical protein
MHVIVREREMFVKPILLFWFVNNCVLVLAEYWLNNYFDICLWRMVLGAAADWLAEDDGYFPDTEQLACQVDGGVGTDEGARFILVAAGRKIDLFLGPEEFYAEDEDFLFPQLGDQHVVNATGFCCGHQDFFGSAMLKCSHEVVDLQDVLRWTML